MEPQLFELILSIKRKCQSNEDRIQKELKISQGEFNGLICLHPDDKILASHFAERMGLSASRGSRVLYKLSSNGYVNTAARPDDRRSMSVCLTFSGLKMKNEIQKRMQACESRICSSLSEKQVNKIKDALIVLDQAL